MSWKKKKRYVEYGVLFILKCLPLNDFLSMFFLFSFLPNSFGSGNYSTNGSWYLFHGNMHTRKSCLLACTGQLPFNKPNGPVSPID